MSNCYDTKSLIHTTRPPTCDKIYYSAGIDLPLPYFHFSKCTRFFDTQSFSNPLRSCINTTAYSATAPTFFSSIRYHVIEYDSFTVSRSYVTDGDIIPVAKASEYWDLRTITWPTSLSSLTTSKIYESKRIFYLQ